MRRKGNKGGLWEKANMKVIICVDCELDRAAEDLGVNAYFKH